ncbi:MAG: ATP-binding protein [Actinomycetota bacterium]
MPELRHQTVVIVAGPPGAGKSTVARPIARAIGAASIDIDETFGPVVPLLVGHPREPVRAAIYASLLATAETSLAAGLHVVVAAPFTAERRDPDAWERLSTRLAARGARTVLVWIHAPAHQLLERLAARGASRDAEKLADPAAWVREAELPPSVPHVAIETTGTTERAVEQILRELGARDRVLVPASGEKCSFSV